MVARERAMGSESRSDRDLPYAVSSTIETLCFFPLHTGAYFCNLTERWFRGLNLDYLKSSAATCDDAINTVRAARKALRSGTPE